MLIAKRYLKPAAGQRYLFANFSVKAVLRASTASPMHKGTQKHCAEHNQGWFAPNELIRGCMRKE